MEEKLGAMTKQGYPASGYAVREIEWLMSTYNVSLFDALWRFPRVVLWLYIPAYAERQGQSAGMSPLDRASIAARREMRESLESCFEIVDAPVSEMGWILGEPPPFIKTSYLNPSPTT